MEPTGLSPKASQALAILVQFPWLSQFYLAGGTALAIQLQHRFSFDLDFFSENHFDQKKINQDLIFTNEYQLDRFAEDTILGILKETKISLFTYSPKLIRPTVDFQKVKLASIADIAAMKLDAIGSRGTKRDFVDLFFIGKKYSLFECFDFYQEKYQILGNNTVHLLKSLTYFEDAENSGQELTMITKVSWEEVKDFFRKEAVRLAKRYLE